MEFDEMKKIWDNQNNRPLFVIDEEALHNRIRRKRNRAEHTANFTEWLLILTNILSALFIGSVQLRSERYNPFMYVVAVWFVLTAIFVIGARWRRNRSTHQFDRTILGDLENAITNTSFQVRISQLIRWNTLPVGAFLLLALITKGVDAWILVLIGGMFCAAFLASGWEHRIYESRKRELHNLHKKLTAEPEASTFNG